MTRAIVVGGDAAGAVEYPIGRSHGDRWRIALRPKMATEGIGDQVVPTTTTVEYADYTVRQFTCDGRTIFVLAPPEWSDLEVMGELLMVYRRAKTEPPEAAK